MNAPLPRERGVFDLARDMESAVERMIRIQMTAYPDCWSDEDKREVAMKHLGFGDHRIPHPSSMKGV